MQNFLAFPVFQVGGSWTAFLAMGTVCELSISLLFSSMRRWKIVDVIDSFGRIWSIGSRAGQSESSVIREAKSSILQN